MIRFERILCPVDFFPASLRSFDYALQLASHYGGRVVALHVISRIIPTTKAGPIRTSEWTGEEEAASKNELLKLEAKAKKAGVPLETDLRIGDIDVQILSAVRDTRADLLVMGTHGRRKFERWAMGSVAERMLRHSPVPLMVMGAARTARSTPPAIRRIVVMADFSDGTSGALAHALSIAQESQAKVTLLHVIQDLSSMVGWKVTRPMIARTRKTLEDLVPAEARLWCDIKTRIETGDPYKVILDVLSKEKPQLAVLGTHGRGMIERMLLGSTAERVVRGGADICPMMLVPPAGKKK